MTAEEFYQKWMAKNNHVLDTLKFAEAYAEYENEALQKQVEKLCQKEKNYKKNNYVLSQEIKALQKENEELKENLLTYDEKMELMDFTRGTDLYQTVDLLFVKQALKE